MKILILSLAFLVAGCAVCREEAHRNDLSCWLQNEIIDCTTNAVVPEVMPIVLQLITQLTGAGGQMDWAALETTLMNMGIRDGGCLLAAIEQRFFAKTAMPSERSRAPAVAAMLAKKYPHYRFRLAGGAVLP